MRADRVEVSWDKEKGKWLVRIQVGEEVIRRRFQSAKDADDQALRLAAQKTAEDEGYEPDASAIIIHR